MCGIAGFLDAGAASPAMEATARVEAMCRAIAHRGPDDSGTYVEAGTGVGLGHRRLSIIDLSPLGHQPMTSADSRYVITYNGEVYNFLELRAELEALGHRFRGGSDTEVMLAAFVAWGVEKAVTRFVGMFAIGLWDRLTRTLYLIRDRLGVKPLYWCQHRGVVLFGSELKALMAHPAWQGEIDIEATAALIRYSYVPTPATIFRNVQKLPPATILAVRAGETPRIAPYWRLRDAVAAGAAHPPGSEEEASEKLEAILREGIRGRMIADVPLGAFLSGGIDSSTVVALMQAQSNRQVRTFSIGFREPGYDEAQHAKAVAAHLGTDHTELYVTPREAIDVVSHLPEWFDEPFADSSQIPTYLVSAMTRKHVTVALSGDGGDELFAGYPRYHIIEKMWRTLAMAPRPLRGAVGSALGKVPEPLLDKLFALAPGRMRPLNAGSKVRRLAALLSEPSIDGLAVELAAIWAQERRLVPAAKGAYRLRTQDDLAALVPDPVSRMQYYDTLTYLPDDIMTKVDRCSMAVALEAREPMLDHRLVEFSWTLPPRFKFDGKQSKRLLRKVLHRYVPRDLVERPKMGFSIPLAAWLRGDLKAWADELLSPARLAADGIFDAREVRLLWDQHQSGAANRENVLWNVLMFQAWKRHYRV